jgi:hypothetical protein
MGFPIENKFDTLRLLHGTAEAIQPFSASTMDVSPSLVGGSWPRADGEPLQRGVGGATLTTERKALLCCCDGDREFRLMARG